MKQLVNAGMKRNWLALYLSIMTDMCVSKSLNEMGVHQKVEKTKPVLDKMPDWIKKNLVKNNISYSTYYQRTKNRNWTEYDACTIPKGKKRKYYES